MGALTVAGAMISPWVLAGMESTWSGTLDAFIGGSLLHVVAHRGTTASTPTPGMARWESGGALAGVLFLVAIGTLSGTFTQLMRASALAEYLQRLTSLAAESAPALLLAYAAAGLIAQWVPQSYINWLRAPRRLWQSLRGMAVGLPLPICSCGVVPLYQTLIRSGAPPTAALAFLVAAPELGIDAFLMSLPLLGTTFSLVRLLAAGVVAMGVALMVGRSLSSSRPVALATESRVSLTGQDRVRRALRAGFGEMLDHTAPWILVGLLVAAALTPEFLRTTALQRLPAGADVVLFAVIGIPTFVCASAATPLVAMLVAGGVSPGAGLAFLLSGPATNLSTIGILARLHGRKTGVQFAVAVGLGAVLAGLLTNLALRDWQPVALSALTQEPPSLLERCSLAVLIALTALSLWRRGPRRFFGELTLAIRSDPHDHDHHNQHDHHHHN